LELCIAFVADLCGSFRCQIPSLMRLAPYPRFRIIFSYFSTEFSDFSFCQIAVHFAPGSCRNQEPARRTCLLCSHKILSGCENLIFPISGPKKKEKGVFSRPSCISRIQRCPKLKNMGISQKMLDSAPLRHLTQFLVP